MACRGLVVRWRAAWAGLRCVLRSSSREGCQGVLQPWNSRPTGQGARIAVNRAPRRPSTRPAPAHRPQVAEQRTNDQAICAPRRIGAHSARGSASDRAGPRTAALGSSTARLPRPPLRAAAADRPVLAARKVVPSRCKLHEIHGAAHVRGTCGGLLPPICVRLPRGKPMRGRAACTSATRCQPASGHRTSSRGTDGVSGAPPASQDQLSSQGQSLPRAAWAGQLH